MKYVSVDIETTGLKASIHSVIEFGAVAWINDGPIEDQPTFRSTVQPDGVPVWSAGAAEMNSELKRDIEAGKGASLHLVLKEFRKFLQNHNVSATNQVHIIGQNFASFDLKFLEVCLAWPSDLISHRFFDVGSTHARKDGMHSLANLPVGKDCPFKVTHTAREDAQVALYHARKFINNQPIEFDKKLTSAEQSVRLAKINMYIQLVRMSVGIFTMVLAAAALYINLIWSLK